jgi:2-oxo-3-hexenedioate decarboxylase/2-keto-4-pentenoate hydratase
MTPDAAARAAQQLDGWFRARTPYTLLPEGLRPTNAAEAYAIQDHLHPLLAGRLGKRVGWKIALTTPQMQKLVGVDRPCLGGIFASTLHHGQVTVKAADYVKLAVECEVAVRLGRAPSAPFTADRLADCVEAAMAGIEIVDDRAIDYSKFEAWHLMAYNAFNHGAVLAPAVKDWRRLDLTQVRGTIHIDGQEVGTGKGGDVMGHPMNALAMAAETLHGRGQGLQAGDIVLTGSVVTTKWPKPGQTAVIAVEGLGEARLSVV